MARVKAPKFVQLCVSSAEDGGFFALDESGRVWHADWDMSSLPATRIWVREPAIGIINKEAKP